MPAKVDSFPATCVPNDIDHGARVNGMNIAIAGLLADCQPYSTASELRVTSRSRNRRPAVDDRE